MLWPTVLLLQFLLPTVPRLTVPQPSMLLPSVLNPSVLLPTVRTRLTAGE